MANRKNFWTTHHEDGWAVKQEGRKAPVSIHQKQSNAWDETRDRAKQSGGEAFLQNREGQIRERNTYGPDQYPPKG